MSGVSLDIIDRISEKEEMVSERRFVLCIPRDDDAASLEAPTIYRALPDEAAASQGFSGSSTSRARTTCIPTTTSSRSS
jgi:hypothetical protein